MEIKIKDEVLNFEESRFYLESEGINVDELIKEGMEIINKVKHQIAIRQEKRILATSFVVWLTKKELINQKENININELFNDFINETPNVDCL